MKNERCKLLSVDNRRRWKRCINRFIYLFFFRNISLHKYRPFDFFFSSVHFAFFQPGFFFLSSRLLSSPPPVHPAIIPARRSVDGALHCTRPSRRLLRTTSARSGSVDGRDRSPHSPLYLSRPATRSVLLSSYKKKKK